MIMQPGPGGGGFGGGFGSGSFAESDLEKMANVGQSAQSSGSSSSSSQNQGLPGGLPGGKGNPSPAAKPPPPPREVGTLGEELVKRPLLDISQEFAKFFDLNALLEIKPGDSPETAQKKQALHSRWSSLDAEQQQVVQQKMQQDAQRKKMLEEEAAQKKQADEANKPQLALPKSVAKGPVGPGSNNRRKSAATLLEQDRKSGGLNKTASSG